MKRSRLPLSSLQRGERPRAEPRAAWFIVATRRGCTMETQTWLSGTNVSESVSPPTLYRRSAGSCAVRARSTPPWEVLRDADDRKRVVMVVSRRVGRRVRTGSPRPCRRSGCRRRSLLSGLVRACPRTSRTTQRARSGRETRLRPSGPTTRGGVRDLRDRATRVHARGAARSGALSWRRTRQRRRNGPYTTTPLGTNGVYGV